MWVIAVFGAAPCQCFTPRGVRTASPVRISSTGPPQPCTRPTPAVTIRTWPRGWMCHAERAPGSNDTEAPDARDGSFASNRGVTRTDPVKFSDGPGREGCDTLRVMVIVCARPDAEASRKSDMSVVAVSFIPFSLVSNQWLEGSHEASGLTGVGGARLGAAHRRETVSRSKRYASSGPPSPS